MLLIRFCEPFRKRKVLLTAKTVAAEGILSFVSPLSRLLGYPPYRILRKFTRTPVPVSRDDRARDQTRPWGWIKSGRPLIEICHSGLLGYGMMLQRLSKYHTITSATINRINVRFSQKTYGRRFLTRVIPLHFGAPSGPQVQSLLLQCA